MVKNTKTKSKKTKSKKTKVTKSNHYPFEEMDKGNFASLQNEFYSIAKKFRPLQNWSGKVQIKNGNDWNWINFNDNFPEGKYRFRVDVLKELSELHFFDETVRVVPLKGVKMFTDDTFTKETDRIHIRNGQGSYIFVELDKKRPYKEKLVAVGVYVEFIPVGYYWTSIGNKGDLSK